MVTIFRPLHAAWLMVLAGLTRRLAHTRTRGRGTDPLSARLRPFGAMALAGALLLGACSDSSDPTGPSGGAPSSLEVSLPATVLAGQAFSLTVTALEADGSGTDQSFSGTVQLSVTQGTIAPSALTVTNGTGSGEFTLSGVAGAVDLTAGFGGVTARAATTVLGTAEPVRIEITPSALLLTQAGEVRQLTALAFDANDQPTVAEVTWRSSSSAVTISPDGLATATTTLGSAQIVAEAAGVTSSPVVALIAQPVPGTVLVADEQVASGPVTVDPADQFGDGWRYQVLLRDVAAPSPGTILLGSGGAMVAGRVVSSSAADSLTAVTLELIPLNQIFQALEVRIDMPMEERDVVEPPAASAFGPRFGQLSYDLGDSELEFPVGPFKCKVGGLSVPQISLQNVTTSVTGGLSGRFDYTLADGFEGVVVSGSIAGQMTARPVIDLVWAGKSKCEKDLKEFTLPIGGWLALFFGFQVPVGVGFSLEGELDLGEVGFDITAQANASLELGYVCSDGGPCSSLTNFNSSADASLRLVTPEDLQDLRVALDGRGYLYAKLNLGPSQALVNRISALGAIKFKLLEASAGVEQSVDLASAMRQVADPGYASNVATKFNAEVKADLELKSGFEWLEKKLGIVIQLAEVPLWQHETILAQTPKGTLKIEPASVKPGNDEYVGEMATFTIELDPVTYLGADAIERVEIVWKKTNGNGIELESGRPSCSWLNGTPGQRVFTCETDFLEEHIGPQTFHALVRAKLPGGLIVPVALEIAANATATVMVEEEEEECECPPVELELDFGNGEPNPTVAGPILETGVEYRISVSGTYTIWTNEWKNGPCKGSPSAEAEGPTSHDAEYNFAVAAGSTLCGSSYECCPNHTSKFRISTNGGGDFDHIHSEDPEYTESHSYEYLVVGEGLPVHFMIDQDSSRGDDYGILQITVSRASESGW